MKDAIIFALALLAAACAENIPLLMAVVVAAWVCMTSGCRPHGGCCP